MSPSYMQRHDRLSFEAGAVMGGRSPWLIVYMHMAMLIQGKHNREDCYVQLVLCRRESKQRH